MLKKQISKNAILYPTIILAIMWMVFFFQSLGFLGNCEGAIIPLVPVGLNGIFFSHFLHGSLDHILNNSLPIAVLTFLLFQFYSSVAKKVLIYGGILTGFLVWLLPPIDLFTGEYLYTCTIGASGLVYVLAFYLFFSGVFRWNMKLLTVSLLVALYYGGLIWGIIPEELLYPPELRNNISWQAHLAGALVGIFLAFCYKKKGEPKQKFIWMYPNYYNEKDDYLWQEYREKYPEDFMENQDIKQKDIVWERLEQLRNNKN